MDNTTKLALKYAWAIAMIIVGLLFNHYSIGAKEFAGYPTLGFYLIYIGFLGLMIITILSTRKPKKLVDERMEYVAAKANRVTFLALVAFAFTVMIIDGIQPITLPYNLFMSYMVCGLLVVYFISYKILLKYN